MFSLEVKTEMMQTLKDHNLSSLQVDVLQVAVVEIEVAAVSFLISELHQVCGRHKDFHSTITDLRPVSQNQISVLSS